MKILTLRRDLLEYLITRHLEKKWEKVRLFFERDIHHPSLETELLEPHWRGVYSFRIDKRYRALFLIHDGEAEIFKITNHYKK